MSGKAITLPASSIKFGHNKDNWSPMAVPVTTPTATVITKPRAQRLASNI